jgi:peptide/nickel transport system permease protein
MSPNSVVTEKSYWQSVWLKLWHDKIAVLALALLLTLFALTLAAPWIADGLLGYSPTATNLRERTKPPTWASTAWKDFSLFSRTCHKRQCDWSLWPRIIENSRVGLRACFSAAVGQCHWLGTDEAGRDVLARALYGGRISLRIGLWVAGIAMTLGVLLGLVSGYFATTFIDDIINALMMIVESIPEFFGLIILATIFQPGPEGLALILGVFGWTGTARLLRGQIFALRERDFIFASRAVGSTSWRIMFRHILPNVASLVIVSAVFEMAGAILAEAGLSYLGVGIGPPLASWGNMMQGSLGNFTDAPWLVIAPGIFIFLTTLAIFLLGDGLRDAFDPWVKH